MNSAEVKYIVDDKGDRTAVIIPINEYEELMEDLHDLAVTAERRDEPTTSFEDLKRKLRADGLL
jgi:PHD/YefM family antitoxin component YafN of YafNO toxin-antitoxin module